MSEDDAIEERDGERGLVNGDGEVVICRRANGRCIDHIYHRIDLAAVVSGEIRPACRWSQHDDGNWLPKPSNTLNDAWRECEYKACFGDTFRAVIAPSPHHTLLREMSVEEFEQAIDKREP